VQVLSEVQDSEDYWYLREEAREFWNHGISDKLVYVNHPVKVARNIVRGIGGKIPEDYIEGRLWFEIHLTFVFEGNAEHLLLCVEFEKSRDADGGVGEVDYKFLTVNRDSPMLVDVAECVESGQKMSRGIRSVVRLKRLQNTHCRCGYSSGILPELLPVSRGVVFKNRELGMCRISHTHLPLGKRPNGLVKGRAKTIKTIPGNQGNLRRNFIHLDPNAVASVLHIVLRENTYRVGFNKSTDLLPQGVKVYLRPTGLMVGVLQGDACLFG